MNQIQILSGLGSWSNKLFFSSPQRENLKVGGGGAKDLRSVDMRIMGSENDIVGD